jgi:hypothetical protein
MYQEQFVIRKQLLIIVVSPGGVSFSASSWNIMPYDTRMLVVRVRSRLLRLFRFSDAGATGRAMAYTTKTIDERRFSFVLPPDNANIDVVVHIAYGFSSGAYLLICDIVIWFQATMKQC